MKKEALELVRKLFHDLKWEIPHNNLEDIFSGAKSVAKIFAKQMAEETGKEEKYEMLRSEIDKITFNQI
jgi:hypothetical protein